VYGRLFTLVTIDDDSKVFAWGIEIDTEDDVEAVIYRKDPATGRTLFGVHDSARAASDRWSSIVPVEVNWEGESYRPSAASAVPTSAIPESSSGNVTRPLVSV
jgi:hypothetical protein